MLILIMIQLWCYKWTKSTPGGAAGVIPDRQSVVQYAGWNNSTERTNKILRGRSLRRRPTCGRPQTLELQHDIWSLSVADCIEGPEFVRSGRPGVFSGLRVGDYLRLAEVARLLMDRVVEMKGAGRCPIRSDWPAS